MRLNFYYNVSTLQQIYTINSIMCELEDENLESSNTYDKLKREMIELLDKELNELMKWMLVRINQLDDKDYNELIKLRLTLSNSKIVGAYSKEIYKWIDKYFNLKEI